MRLRQLGKGRSVCFVIPEDIRIRILELCNKTFDCPIEVEDVLCWSVGETWTDLRLSMPLWAIQGNRFETQRSFLKDGGITKEIAMSFLEDEAQTLETRYRPLAENATPFANWDADNEQIAKIVARCQDFEAMSLDSASLSEKQEVRSDFLISRPNLPFLGANSVQRINKNDKLSVPPS